MAGPDYIVDIAGLKTPGGKGAAGPTEIDATARDFTGRPWLAIHWKCCRVYSRVYRNREGSAYTGRCPRCGRQVNVRVGAGGTSSRFFEAS